MTSDPGRVRVPLALAAAGAVAVLLSFLPTLVEAAGVLAIVIAALVLAGMPEARALPSTVRWRRLLDTGALICAVGVPASLLLETIGGLTAAIGAALVLVAVAFAWP